MPKIQFELKEEKILFIDLPGTKGLRIKGFLRGGLDQPLVIIVHGRGGDPNNTIYWLLARQLADQGISSLRLAMYSHEPKTRDLVDCTLKTHASDFSAVVDYVKSQGAEKVFAVGHSYGGLTVLMAKNQLDAVVLWDPTHGAWWVDNKKESNDSEKTIGTIVVGTSGRGYVYGKSAGEYDQNMGDTTNLAKNKNYPILAITGSESPIKGYVGRYVGVADDPKELIVIEGASHRFNDSDAVIYELLQHTTSWIKSIYN